MLSMRWIVTSAAAVLAGASVFAVGAIDENNTRAALSLQAESRLVLQARNLALSSADALLSEFPELVLHPLVKETLSRQPELAFAVVVDHRGRIQGHPDARELGNPLREPEALEALAPGSPLGPGESLRANRTLIVAEAGVVDAQRNLLGRALVGLPRSHLDGMLARARRQQLVMLGLFVVLAVAATFALMSQLLRPLAALRAGIARIGRGELDHPIVLRDRTEIGALADTVNDMARELRRAQAEMVERERLTQEVSLARRIQQSLLPAKPMSRAGVVVQGDQRAAAEVGGDYYDLLPLPDGRIAIAIADVSGKGLSGCLVMTMLSALLRAYRETVASPSALLATLDERLSESLQPGVFVTMFYGVLDPDTGRLGYASAGHNPTLVYRGREKAVERLSSTGIPLAAIRGGAIRRTLRDEEILLAPGDVLVQYTDGYSEAPSPEGEEFGIARIEQMVADRASLGADGIRIGLREAVRHWTGRETPCDDETLLIVERCTASAGEAAPAVDVPSLLDDGPALRLLTEARNRGTRLELPASLEELGRVLDWLDHTPILMDLHPHDAKILGTALYEACANVVEHGCDDDARLRFELWWLPPPGAAPDSDPTAGPPAARSGESRAEQASRIVRAGHFIIRDDGRPFRPDRWKATDFSDRRVWKQGRGFGLDILQRAMRSVDYHPATASGNVTLLNYGPSEAGAPDEKRVA